MTEYLVRAGEVLLRHVRENQHAYDHRVDRTEPAAGGRGYGMIGSLPRRRTDGIKVMRAIKAALDPQGLMNPGKIFTAKDPT